MWLGAIALRVMLMGAIAAGFSACQSTKTGIATNSDQSVGAEQNLRVVSQKQAVNGVRKQNSLGHTDSVNSVSFSPDGQAITSGSGDNTIKLWKRDGTPIKTLSGPRAHHYDRRKSSRFN